MGVTELFNVVRGTHACEEGTFEWRCGGKLFGVQEKVFQSGTPEAKAWRPGHLMCAKSREVCAAEEQARKEQWRWLETEMPGEVGPCRDRFHLERD